MTKVLLGLQVNPLLCSRACDATTKKSAPLKANHGFAVQIALEENGG